MRRCLRGVTASAGRPSAASARGRREDGEHEPGAQVDLGGGYRVRELVVPHHFVGKSLRELAIRERTGVQVLLVREAGEAAGVKVANPHDELKEGDSVVVAGASAALDMFETA